MPRPQFTLKTLLWLMAVVALLSALGGSGWRRWQRTLGRTDCPAGGSVLIDGQKQGSGWVVTFSSCDSTDTSAVGWTNEQGDFELRTPTQDVYGGAFPGDYLVGIVPPIERLGQASSRYADPTRRGLERYADPNTSGLKATVKRGQNVFHFDLGAQ